MTYYAGLHSTDSGNNTGWLFDSPIPTKWFAGSHSINSGLNSGWYFTEPFDNGYNIYIDWDADGFYLGDLLPRLQKSITAVRGRDTQLAQFQVGTLEITLDNSDKRFSPEYTLSPYYGDLSPGKPIKVQAIFNGVAYDLFTGEIDRISPKPDCDVLEAYILATGMLRRFQAKIKTALLENKTEAEVLAAIVTQVQKSGETLDVSFDAGLDTYLYAWYQDAIGLEAGMEIVKSSLGQLYENSAGQIVFENRAHRAGHTSEYTLNNGHARMLYTYGEKELVNSAITKSFARSAGSLTDIFTLQETPLITGGQTRTFIGVFSDPASSITDPAATTDYTANSLANGTGTDLTANMSVSVTKYAQSVLFTVENTGTQSFYITLLKVRGTPLTVTDSGQFQADDATSQLAHGIKSDEFDGEFIDSMEWAESRSTLIKEQKKNPVSEITVLLKPNTDAKRIQMLSREISDIVTVQETQTAVDGNFYIEKITQRIGLALDDIETEWVLSKVPTVFLWILGTSTLGENTYLGY